MIQHKKKYKWRSRKKYAEYIEMAKALHVPVGRVLRMLSDKFNPFLIINHELNFPGGPDE
jgi:hypothetical protein